MILLLEDDNTAMEMPWNLLVLFATVCEIKKINHKIL